MNIDGKFDLIELEYREHNIRAYFTKTIYGDQGEEVGVMSEEEYQDFIRPILGRNRFRIAWTINGKVKAFESPLFEPENKELRAATFHELFDISAKAILANEKVLTTYPETPTRDL